MEVNTSSTFLIQCAGTLYERDAFLGALVSFPQSGNSVFTRFEWLRQWLRNSDLLSE